MNDKLDILLNSNRMPALFIGSGISFRYISNFPKWQELLKTIGSTIGYNEHQYHAMVDQIKRSTPEELHNQKIASKLNDTFNQKIETGEIDIKTILSESEIKRCINSQISYFKMLISKYFSEINLKPEMAGELELFKQALEKTSHIYTTNYDLFIEKLNPHFKTYTNNDEYFFRENLGLGEIYKLHGSITNPNSMILTYEDFQSFDSNLKLLSSKLINTLIDFPIIFLGYSLSDTNINSILEDFFNSFSKKIVDKISRYMILIQHTPLAKFEFGEKRFGSRNQIVVTTLKTNDYEKIYNKIITLPIHVSSYELRKYKSIFHQIVKDTSNGRKNLFLVGDDKIDDLNPSTSVIAFGPEEKVIETFSQVHLDPPTAITQNRVLMDLDRNKLHLLSLEFNNDDIYKILTESYFKTHSLQYTAYYPVFYFFDKSGVPNNKLHQSFIDNYNHKIDKYKDFVKLAENVDLISLDQLGEKISSIPSVEKKHKLVDRLCLSIFYHFLNRNLTLLESKESLHSIYKALPEFSTIFKKTVCYLDYKKTHVHIKI